MSILGCEIRYVAQLLSKWTDYHNKFAVAGECGNVICNLMRHHKKKRRQQERKEQNGWKEGREERNDGKKGKKKRIAEKKEVGKE